MSNLLNIKASVGKNGVNNARDVLTVQKLLRRDYNYVWLSPDAPVAATGRIDQATINAIIKFQRLAVRIAQPDGLIQPGLRTWKNLLRGVKKDRSPIAPDEVIQAVNRWRYANCIEYMGSEMVTNAKSKTVSTIWGLNKVGNKVAAYAAWAYKVRTGGDWDHKPELRRRLSLDETGDYHFPINGDNEHEWYYDVWSNIHYGYVGIAAGFTADELIFGQSAGGIAGRDDPFDAEAVNLGADLWNSHGKNLVQTQLWQGIISRKARFLEIQKTQQYLNGIDEKRRDWRRHLIPMHNRV